MRLKGGGSENCKATGKKLSNGFGFYEKSSLERRIMQVCDRSTASSYVGSGFRKVKTKKPSRAGLLRGCKKKTRNQTIDMQPIKSETLRTPPAQNDLIPDSLGEIRGSHMCLNRSASAYSSFSFFLALRRFYRRPPDGASQARIPLPQARCWHRHSRDVLSATLERW